MKQPYDCLWDPAKEPTAPLSWCWRRRVRVLLDFADHAATDSAFAIMAMSPQLTFQVLAADVEQIGAYLNKAPGRIADRIIETRRATGDSCLVVPLPHIHPGAEWWPLPNVGIGATITDQASADRIVPKLLQCPAAWRWLRCELRGAVDLRLYLLVTAELRRRGDQQTPNGWLGGIDWIELAGGEDPLHPDWARQLRNQCQAAGVPFWFTGWGDWARLGDLPISGAKFGPERLLYSEIDKTFSRVGDRRRADALPPMSDMMARAGAHASDRLLDGRKHDGLPEIGGAR